MLSANERRRAISGGAIGLAGILLFIGLAIAALMTFDSGPATSTALFDAYTGRVVRFTLLQASLSTLLSVLLAIPVALALARQPRFPGRIWIVRLMAVPMGLPVLIGALGLIGIWGRQGIVNSTLAKIGLSEPVSIYGLSGILLAHVFFNLPLACRLILAGLERIPGEYWLMASGLGMKSLSIFRFLEWPVIRQILPGIAGLIFMLCATSFTLVLILGGGPAATTIEVAIYQSLRFDFDPARAVSLSMLQIGMTAVILAIMALFPAPSEQGITSGKPTRRLDGGNTTSRIWDGATIVLATVFISLPMISIVAAGLRADLWSLATSAIFLRAAMTSLFIALSAATLSVITAISIISAREAIAEQRHQPIVARWFSGLLAGTSSLVLLVPPVVLGSGWFLLLRPFGDVARFAPMLVVLINTLMALPFVIRVLAPAFRTHHARTAALTANLGISGFSRLRYVDWPVLARPLFMALSFAMALSLGDLGAIALFGSENLVTLPWLVYSNLGSYRTNNADGLALILGVFCLLLTIAGTAGRMVHEENRNA